MNDKSRVKRNFGNLQLDNCPISLKNKMQEIRKIVRFIICVLMLLMLMLIVACLNSAYVANDVFKYKFSGERICAQLEQITTEFSHSWSGRGSAYPYLKASYRYTYQTQNFTGGNVWPQTYALAETREVIFLTEIKNVIRDHGNCLQITVDKRNPKDSVIFLPDTFTMIWTVLKFKLLFFTLLATVYFLVSISTNRSR